MAAKVLTPGLTGKYTSEAFIGTSITGDDTIDASRCKSLAIQISSSGSPAGNIDLTHTFNGTDYAALSANIALTDGTIVLLDITDGPFGILRIDGTDVTAGSVVMTIVGIGAYH